MFDIFPRKTSELFLRKKKVNVKLVAGLLFETERTIIGKVWLFSNRQYSFIAVFSDKNLVFYRSIQLSLLKLSVYVSVRYQIYYDYLQKYPDGSRKGTSCLFSVS